MMQATTTNVRPVLFELQGIGRSFGAFRAIDNISFEVRRGQVLGLIGENGAGKSTILNIMCGTDRQTDGRLLLRGKEVAFDSYHDAAKAGVFRVFQELALIPNLSVWENIYLGHDTLLRKYGFIQRADAIRKTQALFDRYGHGWIDVRTRVEDLPFAVQQVVEILRAFALAELLGIEEPIILLDEPTAGLSSDEIEFLHSLIQRVRNDAALVFVSHRLAELLDWSDDILVLKDGRIVEKAPAAALDEETLHFRMVGRAREASFYCEDRQREPESEIVLKVAGLCSTEEFRDVSFELRRGEILGIAGVLGSGKSEVGRAIFGDGIVTEGAIEYRGGMLARNKIVAASGRAIGYVPPDRKSEGIIDTFSVAENMSLARIACGAAGKWITPGRETKGAESYIGKLGVKTETPGSGILSLSGGNQQKAILARWLWRGVDVLILDNPTRGIDAGAKAQIYSILRDVADSGMAMLLISDDLLELIGLSNRIMVMKDHQVTQQFAAPPDNKPTEVELVALMV